MAKKKAKKAAKSAKKATKKSAKATKKAVSKKAAPKKAAKSAKKAAPRKATAKKAAPKKAAPKKAAPKKAKAETKSPSSNAKRVAGIAGAGMIAGAVLASQSKGLTSRLLRTEDPRSTKKDVLDESESLESLGEREEKGAGGWDSDEDESWSVDDEEAVENELSFDDEN